MAMYRDKEMIEPGSGTAFDIEHSPGNIAPLSGIYRCVVCGRECVSTRGNSLPPQPHHKHAHPQPQPIKWKLIVIADHYHEKDNPK
jgi:hypothetical protein